MQLNICTYGNPVLREQAQPITLPDAGLESFSRDMLTAMNVKRGVGLAAPQVGVSRQICVVSFDPKLDVDEPDGPRLNPEVVFPLVLINPVITTKTGRQTDVEGCLSVPDIWAPVTRARKITVEYDDLTGAHRELTARGFLARVVQHEVDHLQGVLFVDRVSPVRKVTLAGELRRMRCKAAADQLR
ncbi:MAG: peptide deformylase [Kiritimatiellia bacterium]|jgi:peptide deformylase